MGLYEVGPGKPDWEKNGGPISEMLIAELIKMRKINLGCGYETFWL